MSDFIMADSMTLESFGLRFLWPSSSSDDVQGSALEVNIQEVIEHGGHPRLSGVKILEKRNISSLLHNGVCCILRYS